MSETITQAVPLSPPAATTGGTEALGGTTEATTKEPLEAADDVAGTAQKTVTDAAATANQPLAPLADTVQETADNAAATVNQAVAPVADTAQKTVDDVAATANQTLAPLVGTAETTVQTVLQTAEPVVTQLVDPAGIATSSLPIAGELVGPVVGDLGTVVDGTLAGAGTTLGVVQPLVGDAARTTTTANGLLSPEGVPRQTAQGEAATVPETPAASGPPTKASETLEIGAARVWTATSPSPQQLLRSTPRDLLTPRILGPGVSSTTLPSAPVGDPQVTLHGGVAMPSSHSHAPVPDIPSGPLTALLSASASAGGGALVILLAALAAALSLAAPGLGRRLRPALAPWPQPILHLSLERPG